MSYYSRKQGLVTKGHLATHTNFIFNLYIFQCLSNKIFNDTACVQENFRGGKFCGFHDFSLNCKPFRANHGLVDQKYVYKHATTKVLL